MSSGTKIATGTGPTRRRLTEAEAQAGCLPEVMTKAEWTAAFAASLAEQARAERLTEDWYQTLHFAWRSP